MSQIRAQISDFVVYYILFYFILASSSLVLPMQHTFQLEMEYGLEEFYKSHCGLS